MDRTSFRALPLLPLVQVAWADGQVQQEERILILKLASDKYKLEEEGMLLLKNWLHHPPSKEYVERGQEALVGLCTRDSGAKLDKAILNDVVQLSQKVAAAAGGLFGFGSVARSENVALKQIAEALCIPDKAEWVAPADQTVMGTKGTDVRRITVEFHTDTLDQIASRGTLLQEDNFAGEQTCPITRDGVVIGRWKASDIQISYDGAVSRRHCRVFERDRRFYVEDAGSSQGTWVNGERIVERRLLGGETIQVGATKFAFTLT